MSILASTLIMSSSVKISLRRERTVKLLAVIVLGIVMLLAAFVDVASAQQIERVAILIPFSVETNYMSQAGYVRYLNHWWTRQWMPFIL